MNFTIGSLSITFGISTVQKVGGMNSWAPRGHYLFWDFDDISIGSVSMALTAVQERFKLGEIHIYSTSPGSWMAVCYDTKPFMLAVNVINETKYVDRTWLSIAVERGYFTVRVTGKNGFRVKYMFSLYPGEQDITVVPELWYDIYEVVKRKLV